MGDTRKSRQTNPIEMRFDALLREVEQLREQVTRSRGTGDVTEQAAQAEREVEQPDLPARIEEALRTRPHSIDELARAAGETVGKVSAALRPLKSRVTNVGGSEYPRWFWIIGDDADPSQVAAAVRALVADRPMTLTELSAATGVRQSRVSGAIVAMQREPETRIAKVGNDPVRARWFLVPADIQIAPLKKH